MSEIAEILEKLDLEDYCDREGIDYRKQHGSSGEQLNVRECPVCGGDKWKVFLNAETGLGNCFSGSCEEKFNKFKFIKAHIGLDGKPLFEYVRSLGKDIGWRPPRKATVAVDMKEDELKMPMSWELPIDGRNLKYLDNRGIGGAIAKYFHLRYCETGLFQYRHPDGRLLYQNYSNRVIIPIFNLEGELVSFQGRDITGTAEKKYLFPPGYASTGSVLYNGHNVRNTHRILVGEGVFDVAAQKIAMDGDEALRDVVPVGTFGKHLSVDQIARFEELIKRGVTEVTIMWDGELSALDAAIDACLLLNGIGLKTRMAMLPQGKDPNEVPPQVVRDSFYAAVLVSTATAIRLKMQIRMKYK